MLWNQIQANQIYLLWDLSFGFSQATLALINTNWHNNHIGGLLTSVSSSVKLAKSGDLPLLSSLLEFYDYIDSALVRIILGNRHAKMEETC